VADLALDPTVVEEQVRRLNRQADSLGLLGVVIGAPLGAVVGGFPLVAHGPIPSKFGIATLLLGALLAGTLGYILAKGRSFGYRLKAQLMLGQLRLEQNIEALLAVNERPAVPALPAGEPMHALSEAPRIEELVDAGLAMPTAAPVFDYTPPAAPEEIASVPEPEPEPEPLTVSEPIQLPSWAADLEHALAAAVPTLTSPAREPAPAPDPEPEPAPAWTLPVREEPAPVPSLPTSAEPVEIASVPMPVPVPAPEPTPAPAWTMPAAEHVQPAPAFAPVAQPDLSTMSIAEIARLGEPQEIAPAPTPVPVPAPEAPLPVWAVPASEHEQEEPEAAPTEPEPAKPDAPRDLSTMSIAEIARLADAGAL
jgi:hypothetical protein